VANATLLPLPARGESLSGMAVTAPPRSVLPPGPTGSTLRMAREWLRRPLTSLEECERTYGPTFTIRISPGQSIVLVSDPEAVREVFSADPEILRSGEANRLLGSAFGPRSLLLLDGREHLHERKMMLPPFHGERMRAYGELIAGVAETNLRGWPTGRAFAVAPHTRAIALEVIMRAVFGVNEPERLVPLERSRNRLLNAITKPYRVFALLMLEPDGRTVDAWRRYAPTLRGVDERLYAEIRLRRAQPDLTERTDILSLLLQARDHDGPPMDDEHLRDELMTLLIAGHETTATALAWAPRAACSPARSVRASEGRERGRGRRSARRGGHRNPAHPSGDSVRHSPGGRARRRRGVQAAHRCGRGAMYPPGAPAPGSLPGPHPFSTRALPGAEPPAPTAGSRSAAARAAASGAPSRPSR
jgi:Cytochrome P450